MSLRVLLTDADTLLLSLYRASLVGQQIDIRTASTGLACVELLRRWRPDVLVLDADLPSESGLDVLAVMREAANVPVVPVLLLAAESTIAAEAALIHDAVVLLKPVSSAVLLNAIRDLVRTCGDEEARHLPQAESAWTSSLG